MSKLTLPAILLVPSLLGHTGCEYAGHWERGNTDGVDGEWNETYV